jgi:ferritin
MLKMKTQKLSQEVVDLLLDRMQTEYNVSFFYRSASNWCNDKGFMKAAKYFEDESNDEITHAKILIDYIVSWNVLFQLPKIEQPEYEFECLGCILKQAYDIELGLYDDYEDTSIKVLKMGEIATFDMLQQLRKIQNDSVVSFSDKLNLLEGVDTKDKFQMLMLQEQLFG